MSPVGPSPDWAALYSAHKDSMHRIAKTVLRGAGLLDQAEDAVQDAMRSLVASPPEGVRNWEAVMVLAAKRKALDLLDSAAVRHAGPEVEDQHYRRELYADLSEDVVEDLDRQQLGVAVRASLKVLSERHRDVVWRRAALEEARAQVAADLGVSPGRVSQITEAALEQLRDEIGKEER